VGNSSQAQGALAKLVNDYPSVPRFHHELGEVLHGLAMSLSASKKPVEARALLEQALLQQQNAVKLEPRNPGYRSQLRSRYYWLARVLLDLKEHTEAAKAAVALGEHADFPFDSLVAAKLLAECVLRAEEDLRLPVEKRKEAADAYGSKAVAILQAATQKGRLNAESLRQDKDFDPLRSRKDFNNLLRRVDEKTKAGSECSLYVNLAAF
jgi:hypothetical protein